MSANVLKQQNENDFGRGESGLGMEENLQFR